MGGRYRDDLRLSHPMRVRGLKYVFALLGPGLTRVAPHAGAWIEIRYVVNTLTETGDVAPHAGAWIEIVSGYLLAVCGASHPMRVRGLKFSMARKLANMTRSHPMRVRGLKYVVFLILFVMDLSHPMRVRGLKSFSHSHSLEKPSSHPMRVRGLKCPATVQGNQNVHVAPHAGAWIEILDCCLLVRSMKVAPHAGAWIEIIVVFLTLMDGNVAPHAGAWIEIPF